MLWRHALNKYIEEVRVRTVATSPACVLLAQHRIPLTGNSTAGNVQIHPHLSLQSQVADRLEHR